ncbi:MAG: riboflavin biosynthesis protein RibF [Opitutales bacterium]|nr:riboflavin biosynthesis protein RibF [Opitutales bacterium]
MFDGVHIGHQAVIRACRTTAHESQGCAAVLTFWPHPSKLIRPDNPTPQILTPAAKRWTIARIGMDLLITLPFDQGFSNIPAEGFIPLLKSKSPTLRSLFVGEQFRFGKGREGDVSDLQRMAVHEGIHVFSMQQCRYDGESISSTRIRNILAAGKFNDLRILLGHPYTAVGNLIRGRGIGRQLGFPTLNIDWQPELQPPHGVYAIRLLCEKTKAPLDGVANYGLRPTFGAGSSPVLEVFLFDDPTSIGPLDEGKELAVEMLHFIRPEVRFENTDALTRQIRIDVEHAKRIIPTL